MRLLLRPWRASTAVVKHPVGVLRRYTSGRKPVQIVNKELCASSVQYSKTLLPKPGTFDLLDLYPGIGQWSRALNETLKPRRHILVEPQWSTFKEHLIPLIDQKDSVYRHVYDAKDALDPKQQLLSAEILECDAQAQQDRVEDGRIRSTPSSQLIIAANLSGPSDKRNSFVGGRAKQFLDDYFRSLTYPFRHLDFHRYGLVKLLAWVPDREKWAINPRGVAGSTKQSVRFAAGFEVDEIASGSGLEIPWPRYRRWWPADMQNIKQVAKRQRSRKLSPPAGREQPLPELPLSAIDPDPGFFEDMAKLRLRPPMVDQIVDLDARIRLENPEWYIGYQRKVGKDSPPVTLRGLPSHMRLYVFLCQRLVTMRNAYKRVEGLVEQRLSLERKIREQSKAGASDAELREKIASIQPSMDELKKSTQDLFKDSRVAVEKTLDDYRALESGRQVLPWNDRTFEPILSKDSDFMPGRKLCLMLFTPRPDFVRKIDSADKQICLEYLTACLIWHSVSSVARELNRIMPGGLEYMTKAVPSLTDPAQGGWHDLEQITCRTLPPATIIDMAVAFERWPPRPSAEDLLNFTSGLKPRGESHKQFR